MIKFSSGFCLSQVRMSKQHYWSREARFVISMLEQGADTNWGGLGWLQPALCFCWRLRWTPLSSSLLQSCCWGQSPVQDCHGWGDVRPRSLRSEQTKWTKEAGITMLVCPCNLLHRALLSSVVTEPRGFVLAQGIFLPPLASRSRRAGGYPKCRSKNKRLHTVVA